MITLFRRIRQKLIDSGSVTKYLLYAIGEILLVVIGILIALQVNNWNEENKTRAQEVVLRANLEESLASAAGNAEFFVSTIENNIRLLEYTLQNWENLSPEGIQERARSFLIDNFSPIFYLTSYSQFYTPELDVYNTAVSDGSISIIQDEDFLNKLDRLSQYFVPRVNELMAEEYLLSQSINDHIANNYGPLFLDADIADNTLYTADLWEEEAYEAFFKEIGSDGVLKFKLAHRLELKRSRLLLVNQLLNVLDNPSTE